MSSRLLWWTLGGAVLLAACTGDFDAFDFSGAPGGSSSGGASNGGGGTGNTSTGGSGNTSNGGGGSGNASTGGGGSGMGGSATVLVDCGASTCDVASNAACCVDLDTEDATCPADGKCAGNDVKVECDGPEDCPGEICCATTKGGDYDKVRCKGSCSGGNDNIVCHVGDDAPCGGDSCQTDIPGGYGICQ